MISTPSPRRSLDHLVAPALTLASLTSAATPDLRKANTGRWKSEAAEDTRPTALLVMAK
jgi:hypothetical protein